MKRYQLSGSIIFWKGSLKKGRTTELIFLSATRNRRRSGISMRLRSCFGICFQQKQPFVHISHTSLELSLQFFVIFTSEMEIFPAITLISSSNVSCTWLRSWCHAFKKSYIEKSRTTQYFEISPFLCIGDSGAWCLPLRASEVDIGENPCEVKNAAGSLIFTKCICFFSFNDLLCFPGRKASQRARRWPVSGISNPLAA